MLIKADTKLADLQKEFLNEESIFYKKVKELSDSNGRNLGLNTIQEIYLFLYFIGQGENDTESKYSKKFIDMRSMTMQSWKGSIGQLLYKENKTVLNEDCQKIVENYEYFGDYVKMIDVYKFRFNPDTHKPFLDDNNIENLQKIYNYFCDNSVMNITLGDLQQEMIDAGNDVNKEKTDFVKWALNKAKDINDGAFWFFMSMVLGGASKVDESHKPGENIRGANVAFKNICNEEYKYKFDWYYSNATFTGKKQTNKKASEEEQYNKLLRNLYKKNDASKITLNDLKNYIYESITNKDKVLQNKIEFKLQDFFGKGSNTNVEDKIKKIDKICDELIECLQKNEGGGNMIKVEEKISESIKNNNQVIFTGAPGTGKTYSVRKYVKEFGDNHYKFVQFHPSYDYSDFIEGLRPVTLGNSSAPTFVRIDGAFKKFCRNIVESNLNNIFVKWSTFSDDTKKKILEMIFVTNRNFDVVYELINIDSYSNLRDKLEKLIETIGRLRKMMFADNDIETTDNIDINNAGEDGKKNNDGDHFTTSKDVKEKVNEKEWEVINDVIRDESIDLSINDNYGFKWYYFVVDEINRADLSKVFGEIMFGLEESYRGIENRFDTQYMNLKAFEVDDNGNANRMGFDCFEKGFFIPRNLKFIGTMNDIDRSVESFDFALRRRFKWIDIKANEVMLESLKSILDDKITQQDITIDKLADRVISMNNIISEDIGKKLGLNEAFHIGPAYFKSFDGSKNKLKDIFNSNIESILREYTRGRREDEVKKFIEKCKIELLADLNKAENPQSQNIANNNPDVSGVNN